MALKAKRVLSCLVTALMLLTLLPVSAFAADNDLKTELGITNNDITVTEITEDNSPRWHRLHHRRDRCTCV